MSYNGSGTFLINSAGQPVVPGTTITTTAFNALTADLASGLTTAMTKDGQTVPTANIPMGGFKLTGLGAGTSATDAAQFGQLQNAPVATLITVSGADTITGTLVQTLTAYATGQQFSFVAAGTNTTAVTLNIDGLGAKAVTRTGAVALDAGALVSGQMAIVEYDGTRFQLINANAFTNLTVSGALTVGTTLAVTGVATLTAQPILSSLTASLPVFSDASKGLVSNAMTGTGSVMMSASPTTTGTLTAAAINASGLVAMAGAATVGTTLAVTGTSTMAAINASGTIAGTGVGGITLAVAQNTLTNFSATNSSAGTGARTGYGCFVDGGQVIYQATSSGYTDITGGADAAMVAISNLSGGFQVSIAGNPADLKVTAGAVTIPGTLGVTGAISGTTGTFTKAAAGDVLVLTNGGATPKPLYFYSDASTSSIGTSASQGGSLLGFVSTTSAQLNISGGAVQTWTTAGTSVTGTLGVSNAITVTNNDVILTGAGQFKLASTASAAGTTVVHNANGYYYDLLSSRRYKENFRAIPNDRAALDRFLKLTPGLFDLKNDLNDKNVINFYAEDAADAEKDGLLSLTNYNSDGAPQSLRDYGFSAYQQLVLQDHEARLAALQADFEAYKSSHP